MARAITVVVGALATADADGYATAQTAVGAQFLALNGALTGATTANNVCQSQTPAGADNLTLNGTLASSAPTGAAVAYLGGNSRVYLTTAANLSNRTFTITGLYAPPNGGALVAQVETFTGPNASIIASQKEYFSISQIAISGSAAGALTIGRAGTGVADMQRRIAVDSDGDDSDITFALVGLDGANSLIGETLTGANASVATSVLSYKTLLSVLTSGAVQSTVEIGTSAVAASQPILLDNYASLAEVGLQVKVTGTVNFTVQQTLDNPTQYGSPVFNNWAGVTWFDHPTAGLVAATASAQGNYAFLPQFTRIVLNSGTGSVTYTVNQAGIF